ncbi:MAG: TlpA family protein disulfide reductase [Actinobacteria bacterium]|nr:TlpA family protein disulfide reductase [Actinomycetota bacterium]
MSTKPAPQKKKSGSGNATFWIGAAIAIVVGAAAVVAITMSGSSDDSSTGDIKNFGTVTVAGEPLPVNTGAADDPAIGTAAPVLTGEGFTGNVVTTAPGAPTLIIFLAHWCPNCQAEVPKLVEWYESGGVPDSLDVIAVATQVDPTLPNFPPSQWLTREGFPKLWPVMLDDAKGTAANAMGADGWPYFVLLDADGKVMVRRSGQISSEDLTNIVSTALGLSS